MKLSIILLLATCMQVSAKGYSQKLNLNLKNVSYSRAFSAIEQKTNFRILFSDDLLPSNTININIHNATIDNVLDYLLIGSNLTYKVLDNNVIVISKNKNAYQNKTVTGTVTDSSGKGISGVTVLVKGSPKGTMTDAQGNFSIEVPDNAVLVFTFIGFQPQEVPVTGTTVNVKLLPAESMAAQDVVVTALGVKRSEKSLGYSTQVVNGAELTKSKTDNVVNALNGKVAGLSINPGSGGVGSSAKVVLRGSRSASGNNQPLYVIDGIPMTNTSRNPISTSSNGTQSSPSGFNGGQSNSTYGGNDGGDGISNLNPEDIESMTVLEGASAAALYGSQAANGVIVITTKKGADGKMKIDFTSNTTISNIAYKPKFQNEYGSSSATAEDSWGDKISGSPDYLDDFFRTGSNFTNSISLSGGNKNLQNYFSYANTTGNGVQPTNKLERNNFNLREVGHFLNDKLTVDANINYITQKLNNIPAFGYYSNPLTGLYLFPRGRDISQYKSNYLNADSTGYGRQNWYTVSKEYLQNPWWVLYKEPNVSNRNRIIANASLKYDFNPNLSLQARGSIDRTFDTYESDEYSGTISILSKENGQFSRTEQTLQQKYADLLLNFKIPLHGAFKIDGVAGTSYLDTKTDGLSISPGLGLVVPDLFLAQNIEVQQPGTTTSVTASNVSTVPNLHTQIQSVFGNLNFSYKDWAFLSLSGRNDWSSSLSNTASDHFFYPSANLSLVLNQVLHLPKVISYLKLRGSVAQVGNTVPPYVSYIVNYLSTSASPVLNSSKAFHDLKPEKTNSVEGGADMRFFNDRLNFSFTWYKSNTKNQFIPFTPAPTTGYGLAYVNAGNIQNAGMEFTLGYDVINSQKFSWNTSVNASFNRNKILDIDSRDNINNLVLTGGGGINFESILTKGGQYGDMYAMKIERDAQNRMVLNADGTPVISSGGDFGGYEYLGNPNPKFQAGWNNQFTYKNFTLSFLVDGKFGGQVFSQTQGMMDYEGVSEATAKARDAGGVKVSGVTADGQAVNTTVDAQTWYQTIGNYKQGAADNYVYSATVVRLRELSIGYKFPFSKGVIKGLDVSLSGRNLIYFYKKAPFDPEVTMSTGNGMAGVDMFGMPATRNIGLNVNVHL